MSVMFEQKDETIFKVLLEKYFSRLQSFAFSYLKSNELAQEVVMDVFLRLWDKGIRKESINNMDTYLYVAVRNTCKNYLRDELKIKTDPLDNVKVDLAIYEVTPEEDLISKEMLHELNNAVENLPPKCKMVFKMLREEGLSRKDTAKVLGISVNTVDNQIAIAVKKIGEALGIDLSLGRNFSSLRSFLLMF